MTDSAAIKAAQELRKFCGESDGCQNCVFREFGTDRWGCLIGEPGWWEVNEARDNLQTKRRNHGYL